MMWSHIRILMWTPMQSRMRKVMPEQMQALASPTLPRYSKLQMPTRAPLGIGDLYIKYLSTFKNIIN